MVVRGLVCLDTSPTISGFRVQIAYRFDARENGFQVVKLPIQWLLVFVKYDQYIDAFIYQISRGHTYEPDSARYKLKITLK